MNAAGAVVIALVKSAITQQKVDIPGEVNWDRVLELSREHQIVSMVYHGIKRSGVELEPTLQTAFFRKTCQDALLDQVQAQALNDVRQSFETREIKYMLLKGSLLKALYPKPEMRVMSDVDILIDPMQYDKIRDAMLTMGYREGQETDHELIWRKLPYLHVELHKRLVPSYNSDYCAYFEDSWEKTKAEEQTSRFYWSDEDHLVFLVTHFAKHYRDGGIGIRHLTDIWLLVRKKPDLDHAYMNRELEKLKLAGFYFNILKTAETWFDDVRGNEITDLITRRIVASGSYGTQESGDTANAARVVAQEGDVSCARRKSFVRLIFMPMKGMKEKYPILNRIPVLLPVMWGVRWGSAILFKRDNIMRQKKRLEKIVPTVVDSYTAELDAVGLRFDL